MPDDSTTSPVVPAAPNARFVEWLRSLSTSLTAFGGPSTLVRATITFIFVGIYLWMQWNSPKDGAVPAALVSAASVVTGFYLTSDASVTMKALLSIVYAAAFAAFLCAYQWVPGEINGQVMLILGVYFGKKVAESQAVPTLGQVKKMPPEARAEVAAHLDVVASEMTNGK